MNKLLKITLVASVMILLNSCIGCRLYEDVQQECPEQSDVRTGVLIKSYSNG
ncbi:MAG: hypothetical protein ACI857_002727 [Arenicella sp.]|jgi:hypothetical protein